jgi:hypothetical protein
MYIKALSIPLLKSTDYFSVLMVLPAGERRQMLVAKSWRTHYFGECIQRFIPTASINNTAKINASWEVCSSLNLSYLKD